MYLSAWDLFPKNFRLILGKEFYNSHVVDFLGGLNVTHFSTNNAEIKAGQVERLNRTISSKLYRYFTHYRTNKWTDVIQKLVEAYNHEPHRALGLHSPSEVTKENAGTFYDIIYKDTKLHHLLKRLPKVNFELDDFVRISLKKGPLEKGYTQAWSSEVYKSRYQRNVTRRSGLHRKRSETRSTRGKILSLGTAESSSRLI